MTLIRTVSCIILALVLSCGTLPTKPRPSGCLSVAIFVGRTPAMHRDDNRCETIWDRLLVCVSCPDQPDLRDTIAYDPEKSLLTLSLEPVTAGLGRIITAWTITAQGDTIHRPAADTVSVVANQTSYASLELKPCRGSIYIELSGFDQQVDSLILDFRSGQFIWSSRIKRQNKVYGALDNIPYGISGSLSIVALATSGDTVSAWVKSPFILSDSNQTLTASFVTAGKISVTANIFIPGITLVQGIISTTDTLRLERNGPDSVLIISELLFTGGSSSASADYVEIFNPCPYIQNFDTLFMDVLTTTTSVKTLTGLSVAAYGYLLIANAGAPAAWKVGSTCSLDLPSTSALIALRSKRGEILDRVFYENEQNILGWPKLVSSAKVAVALDTVPADPAWNNYGRNWHKTVSISDAASPGYTGTPGRSGL